MKYEPIKKSLKITPHLQDYDQTCRDFTWDEAQKEVAHFSDGTTNIAYNALDRHLGTDTENKTAMIWVNEKETKSYTFSELSKKTNQFANVLKKYGVAKGDRVFMFLPRIPELYISFLGALKLGAIAGNMFAAFGYEALEDRLKDSGAKVLVTTPELLERVNKIRNNLPELQHIFLVEVSAAGEGKGAPGEESSLLGRELERGMDAAEIPYWPEMNEASEEFEVAHMDSEDPSYILYTSGTTGKPKGVVHTHGDIVQQHLTTKWILDLHPEDAYWCTADPGWVTGVVYGIIGPWSNGITQIVYDGRFDPDIWYGLIEKYKVTVWYTAPTAIRMLMTDGELLKKHDLSSLRYIASVGEPLNPEAIVWAQKNLNLPIHDNYWQTETGSIVVANYASMDIRPGSMGRPFPGIHAGIVDNEGNELPSNTEGNLCFKPGWPSMMKTIWNNPERFEKYFLNPSQGSQGSHTSQQSHPWYLTGDRAWKDEDGYFWFVGRDDDVIKTAGERVGPFEVESALMTHPSVAEAGVIGKPDPVRGEIIKAFIKLKPGQTPSEELKEEIQKYMKKELAGHAYPREIDFVEKLPKTRSGKIMRRVLKMKEMGQDVGDVSTMEEY
jgi:acetyl-CoA synthetase